MYTTIQKAVIHRARKQMVAPIGIVSFKVSSGSDLIGNLGSTPSRAKRKTEEVALSARRIFRNFYICLSCLYIQVTTLLKLLRGINNA